MQPAYEIKFHPVDLSRHGKNPQGLPIYRVVWCDTRKTKLEFRGKTHVIPRYPADPELNTGAHWILERWKSPEEFLGISREQYEEMMRQFPYVAREDYPADGEYDFEYGFPGEVDEALLHKAIELREHRRKTMKTADYVAEAQAAEAVADQQKEQKFTEMCLEAREESLRQ